MEALYVHEHCVKPQMSIPSPMAATKVYAILRHTYMDHYAIDKNERHFRRALARGTEIFAPR